MQLPIRLDQFLKKLDIAQTGGHAKWLISQGLVHVNGEKEHRRGRKLYANDIVSIRQEAHQDPDQPPGPENKQMNEQEQHFYVGKVPSMDNRTLDI